MKITLITLALLLAGCLTEPRVIVTDCRDVPFVAQPEALGDSTNTLDQVCRWEEK